MYLDMRDWDKLVKEVLADEIVLDYTRMFGGEPQKLSPQSAVEDWKGRMKTLSSTQHTTAYVLTPWHDTSFVK